MAAQPEWRVTDPAGAMGVREAMAGRPVCFSAAARSRSIRFRMGAVTGIHVDANGGDGGAGGVAGSGISTLRPAVAAMAGVAEPPAPPSWAR